ncbi:hypothetical protein JHL17_24270 [Azospirillum sp. YIM B02556]|uniref:Uncharacterized protein n=1 Tax=Azospirillum endophyticum TaxID=2800326 RepID=A0ABS1FAQ5_9PROT|nr:hypothetical protein [Azospirillum endophyticum]MBK1840523.1 hypothetical protein [Azospirillum endophyticum]
MTIPTANDATAGSGSSMQVSLRESRLVLERLMQVTRVEPGLVPSLRDCALYSAALGLGGFPELLRHLDLLRTAKPIGLRLLESADMPALEEPVAECAGQHAWIVAPALVDLCVERHRRGLPGVLVARNLIEADELRIAGALAEANGLSATVTVVEQDGGTAVRLSVRPRADGSPTVLDTIRRHGIPVETALWWRLFHLANEALAPDSYTSRRHAGAIMVTADGRVVGRQDEDDTDLSLLHDDASAA